MTKVERELFRAAVFVIIRDKQGRVLLMRRANTGYLDGHYDFPSGHVDPKESFASAIVRETKEEAGLDIVEKDLKVVHLNQNYSDFPYINVVFSADKWRGEPRICEPDKCDDIGYFAVDDLPEKCSLAVRYIERAGFDTAFATSFIELEEFKNLTGTE